MKEFWKSINISRSYAQKNFGVFFMPHSVDIMTLQLDYACDLWTLQSQLSCHGDISDWISLHFAGGDETETESNLLV